MNYKYYMIYLPMDKSEIFFSFFRTFQIEEPVEKHANNCLTKKRVKNIQNIMNFIYHIIYSRVQKSIENFDFRAKMTIFQRVGMREGGLPLPLAFQYLIFMI